MRWHTANRRAARKRREAVLGAHLKEVFAPFKLYPYQRDVIDWLDTEAARINEDRFTVDDGERKYQFFVATASGTDASWLKARFLDAMREAMIVPPEFIGGKRGTIIIDEHFKDERYRK